MPNISLLQLETVTYKTVADLERLIKVHRDLLNEAVDNLKNPKTDAIISAVAYNLAHLMRELQKFKRQKAKLLVLDGGKKD
ncbi:MAG: hypothetical protein DRI24_21795 [Deltaproteobacteria bacterium]|nr:MAG: hypothetical protein DRI24_21795 [Deltaproteobacteria bacterium]